MTAPNLNYALELDLSNGESQFFSDQTIDEDFSLTKQIRLLCGNYPNTVLTTSLSEGEPLEKYREYRKTSGSPQVYDNKTISSGDLYIPFTDDEVVLSGDTFSTTGIFSKYISPATYLPTSSFNVLVLNTSYWGYTSAIFPSAVQYLQYEIYVDTSPDPLTNVTEDYQYIVTGTGSDTVEYDGNTYRVGEVFIASDNGAVTFNGTANLKILSASVNNYQTFIWELLNRFYLIALNQDNCGCSNNPIMCQIQVEIAAMDWANYTHWVSATKATETIRWIEQQILILERGQE